jgi:lysophospholipase L1-like esterase
MDQSLLSKMYAELNTELILMQFGGNSVPFFKDSSSVRSYAYSFKSQLNTIKKLRPSAAIVVIGPSDMSKLENGVFVSYPYLSYCVAQMKKVTLEVGGGYWDLYSAMGGKNSMPSWVEKGLAGKDYIHFSNQGASIISQLFFDAFAAEFAKWQLKTIQ